MINKNLNIKIKTISVLCLSLLVSTIAFYSCSTDETQTVTNFTDLTWQDEFDVDGAPNSEFWSYNIGGDGWGNNELQYYTDRSENVKVQDGMLHITAIQEDYEGSGYTSARLVTKVNDEDPDNIIGFEQKHGRFEARMKLPFGKGMWPAFWLLGSNIDDVSWPNCGEIDIMENGGSSPTLVSGAVHGPGYSGGEPIVKEYEFENTRVDTEFHIYGIEWGSDYINYYVDDVLYNQITPDDVTGDWVFNNGPFFIIINLAVGGNFDGNPSDDTVFPQTMEVDYVRVYQE